MTPERRNEIEMEAYIQSKVMNSQMLFDCLAEIDRLAAENAELKARIEGGIHCEVKFDTSSDFHKTRVFRKENYGNKFNLTPGEVRKARIVLEED